MSHANPGIHHVKVGDAVVSALNDGQFEADIAYVTGLPAEQGLDLLRGTFRVIPPRITISCFLVQLDGKRILIDSGAGAAMGGVCGHAGERLAALGVAPGSIDTILITHAHVDHVTGLIDGSGAAVFPNASLYVHEAEVNFWLNKEVQAQAPEAAQPYFGYAQNGLNPYRDRLHTVKDGEQPVAGFTAVHLPGHTPGHSGWALSSGGESLLIWGDVVHLPGIQFAAPEAGMAFDIDGDLARATRARALDMVTTDRLLLAGMHLDFPTFGHVRRAGAGYAFEPMVWAPTDAGLFV